MDTPSSRELPEDTQPFPGHMHPQVGCQLRDGRDLELAQYPAQSLLDEITNRIDAQLVEPSPFTMEGQPP